jgi:hypothetical protein
VETPANLFDSWITPVNLFFVRNHMSEPTTFDAEAYRLKISGEVEHPLELSLADLRRLETATVRRTSIQDPFLRRLLLFLGWRLRLEAMIDGKAYQFRRSGLWGTFIREQIEWFVSEEPLSPCGMAPFGLFVAAAAVR